MKRSGLLSPSKGERKNGGAYLKEGSLQPIGGGGGEKERTSILDQGQHHRCALEGFLYEREGEIRPADRGKEDLVNRMRKRNNFPQEGKKELSPWS